MKKYFIIFLTIFLSRSIFINLLPAFFDGPEYIKLIENNNLFLALVSGHEPIHPGFILINWLFYHLVKIYYPLNVIFSVSFISSFFGSLTLLLFFLIIKKTFSNKIAWKSLLIVSLLPGIWLSQINVLIEPIEIFFFILAMYSFILFNSQGKKVFLFIGGISLSYAIFTHTIIILWTPVLLSLPLLFSKKNLKEMVYINIVLVIVSIMLGISITAVLLINTNHNFIESVATLFIHGKDFITWTNLKIGLVRSIRNFLVTILRNNSTFIVILALFGFIKILKSNKKLSIFIFIWFLPVFLTSQYWHIGLFGRLSLIASFPLALLASQIKNKTIYILSVVNLIVISIPLMINNKNAEIQQSLKNIYEIIPKKDILIGSNLIRPQTYFYGTKYFINEPGFTVDVIEKKLQNANNKEVFIDSQALFNPYYSYDGNHLHILSLGKIGNSEIKKLIKNNRVELSEIENPDKRIFLYKVLKENEQRNNIKKFDKNILLISGKEMPGTEVFLFSKNWKYILNPYRMDYRDTFSWIVQVITNKRDPLLWAVADKEGTYSFPIDKKNKNEIYLKKIKDGKLINVNKFAIESK